MKKKFPSLFKLPTHLQFNYEPRYYDPVKDDIEERTAIIKHDLRFNKEDEYNRSAIQYAFAKRLKAERKTSVLQYIVLLVVFLTLVITVGFLYFGNQILSVMGSILLPYKEFIYLLIPLFLVYIAFRLKRYSKRK